MARPVVITGQCLWFLVLIHAFLAIPILEWNNRFLKHQRRLQSKIELQRNLIRQRQNHSKPDVPRLNREVVTFFETPNRRSLSDRKQDERLRPGTNDEKDDTQNDRNVEIFQESDNLNRERALPDYDLTKNRLVNYKRYKNCFLSPVQCVVRFWASNNVRSTRFQ
uniref:Uncharacterized protein n=1 Tax=Romanomermis culicivorax TaxID=13658 RepID=A0A915ILV8_ROMCU